MTSPVKKNKTDNNAQWFLKALVSTPEEERTNYVRESQSLCAMRAISVTSKYTK